MPTTGMLKKEESKSEENRIIISFWRDTMSRNWNQVFSNWSAGPSETEENKISNTLKNIRQAIHDDLKLKTKDLHVYVQGSYKNNVNVRLDSDVDVGVLCNETVKIDSLDADLKRAVLERHEPAKYEYSEFKNDLENALVNHFGKSNVKRGNKSFDINESSTRVDADVVAVINYKRFYSESSFHEGVSLFPDDSEPPLVINWPEQHYNNGVKKNTETGRKYKRVVRILKRLRNEMLDNGYSSLNRVPGFLIECLVWNTKDFVLMKSNNYYNTIDDVLRYLFDQLARTDNYKEWGEVSELKYLFNSSQSWDEMDAQKFIKDAWNYVGYQNDK